MQPHEALAGLAILSAVNGAITWIITESSLFDRVRERISGVPLEVLSCPLCTGTWVGAGIAGVTTARLEYGFVDMLLGGIVITFSTLMGGLLLKRWASY